MTRESGSSTGRYEFEAPAAFLDDLFLEEERFAGNVLPPRLSRGVSGMTSGS